jgi:hypothetical protein
LKLCRANGESEKKQRHPHTSQRKSHARLKKEMVIALLVLHSSNSDIYYFPKNQMMLHQHILCSLVHEDKKKGSITMIDLWDETHKKKNGDYVNQDVQRLMVYSLIYCSSVI